MNQQTPKAQGNLGIRGGVNFAKEVTDDDTTDTRTGLLVGLYTTFAFPNSSVSFLGGR